MQLVFILIFLQLLYFFEVVKVVRTLRILAFMNNKVFTVLYRFKYVRTMRTAKLVVFCKPIVFRWWMKVKTDLASYLWFFSAIIPGEIRFRSIADRAGAILGYITFNSAESRFDGFAITFFVVRDEIIPFLALFIGNDTRKFVNFKFLVCRRFGVIISPLFKRDIFTDK